MAAPTRFPQGISNAAPWQFFGPMGQPNPFFYHTLADDFDEPLTQNGWTVTPLSTGTVALTAGDGGLATFTTAATNNDTVAIQRAAAAFQPVLGKKMFFIARITLGDVVASGFVAGMMPVTTTVFTAPANGVWVSKATGSTVINLNVANNGTVTTTPFQANSYALTNGVSFDVGVFISGQQTGTIQGSIGPDLVKYTPQSGTGTAGSTNRSPNLLSTVTVNAATTLQATPLSPTVGLQAGAAAVKTLVLDFTAAARER